MPTKTRRIYPGLIDRLAEKPYQFEFFQAVRLLLACQRQYSPQHERDILGQVIQFRSSVSLVFPPSEIESLEIEWGDAIEKNGEESEVRSPSIFFRQATLTPSFIGLTGPSGVLPRHYTQYAAEREMYGRDGATRAFLDIFASRVVALFYQAWLKHRLPFQYEMDRKNNFLPHVLSLAGLGLNGVRKKVNEGEQCVKEEDLAYYACAFRTRPQSAEWFARIVADYFRVTTKMEQFIGQWIRLSDSDLTRLGASNSVLGRSAFCGDRVWDRQGRLRLKIGPIRRKTFDEFLPGGLAFRSLGRLFELMMGVTFDCEVRLILDRRDICGTRLGSQSGARLGWASWLTCRDSAPNSEDVRYLIGSDTRRL